MPMEGSGRTAWMKQDFSWAVAPCLESAPSCFLKGHRWGAESQDSGALKTRSLVKRLFTGQISSGSGFLPRPVISCLPVSASAFIVVFTLSSTAEIYSSLWSFLVPTLIVVVFNWLIDSFNYRTSAWFISSVPISLITFFLSLDFLSRMTLSLTLETVLWGFRLL